MSTNKWDSRFMKIAREVSTWSKDPGHRVGAVFVLDRRILASGYNGIPSGMVDDDRVQDRGWKLQHTIHAEMNGILNAARNGVSLFGSTLYVFGLPVCSDCAKHLCQAGIHRLVMPVPDPEDFVWIRIFESVSKPMLEECGVAHEFIDIS